MLIIFIIFICILYLRESSCPGYRRRGPWRGPAGFTTCGPSRGRMKMNVDIARRHLLMSPHNGEGHYTLILLNYIFDQVPGTP